MTSSLSSLDYGVILAYLLGTLAVGLWIGSRVKSGTDYFLAGRRLPWWAIGMSLVATDISGTDMIGAGGAAYAHGLAVANFEWIGCVPAMIVAAFLFVPFFYRTGIYTIPEFMERRYNVGVRSALATCWLIFMACNLGVMLLAAAKMGTAMVDVNVLAWVFGAEDLTGLYEYSLLGWRPVPSDKAVFVWLAAAIVGTYTVSGGLAADVWTDVVQCVLMITGCLAVLVIGLKDIGGIDALYASLPTEAHALIVPADAKSPYPWPAIYFGLALILSPAYWIGNQAIIQRSLGAENEFAAKASYVWGAVLKTCIPLIIVVPGLIARVKFPGLENNDHAVPRLVVALLPSGVRGMFVGAFVAALMSSVNSYLNSASTIVSHDFYKRFIHPAADDRRLLKVGRVTTLAFNVWAILFALWLTGVDDRAGIYAIFQTLMAFFQGPALAILVGGLFWRRATGKAALVSFVCGIACSASLFALSQATVIERLGWKPLFRVETPFLYFSVWAFAVTLVLLVVLSLATRPEGEEKTRYVLLGFTRRSA